MVFFQFRRDVLDNVLGLSEGIAAELAALSLLDEGAGSSKADMEGHAPQRTLTRTMASKVKKSLRTHKGLGNAEIRLNYIKLVMLNNSRYGPQITPRYSDVSAPCVHKETGQLVHLAVNWNGIAIYPSADSTEVIKSWTFKEISQLLPSDLAMVMNIGSLVQGTKVVFEFGNRGLAESLAEAYTIYRETSN